MDSITSKMNIIVTILNSLVLEVNSTQQEKVCFLVKGMTLLLMKENYSVTWFV